MEQHDGNTPPTPQDPPLEFIPRVKQKIAKHNRRKPGERIQRLTDPTKKKSNLVSFKVDDKTHKKIYKMLDARFKKGLSNNLSEMFTQIIKQVEPNHDGEFYTGQ